MSDVNVELARGIFDAFADRDVEAMLALMTEDVEFLPVTANIATDGMPYRGHEGIRQYFEDAARLWGKLRLFPDEIRPVGDTVVVTLGRIHARGGGMILDRPTGWVWGIRDGRIASGRVYGSHGEAIEAAAAMARRTAREGE